MSDFDNEILKVRKEHKMNTWAFALSTVLAIIGIIISLIQKEWLQAVLWLTLSITSSSLNQARSCALIWKENYLIMKNLVDVASSLHKEQESSLELLRK